jgi:hypothetical protein
MDGSEAAGAGAEPALASVAVNEVSGESKRNWSRSSCAMGAAEPDGGGASASSADDI